MSVLRIMLLKERSMLRLKFKKVPSKKFLCYLSYSRYETLELLICINVVHWMKLE
jgi:hypothetical protein